MSTPSRYAPSLSVFAPYQGKGGLIVKIVQFVNVKYYNSTIIL